MCEKKTTKRKITYTGMATSELKLYPFRLYTVLKMILLKSENALEVRPVVKYYGCSNFIFPWHEYCYLHFNTYISKEEVQS